MFMFILRIFCEILRQILCRSVIYQKAIIRRIELSKKSRKNFSTILKICFMQKFTHVIIGH